MLESVNIDLDEGIVEINGKPLHHLDNFDHDNSPTGFGGACKTVYIGDEYVVKVTRNLEEVQFEPDKIDRPHFAKVVFADINREWYIQERVNCVPRASFCLEDVEIISELVEKYGIGDVDWSFEGDDDFPWPWTHNWIVDIHGTPIIFDYSSD